MREPLDDLETTLRDLAAVALELSHESLAIAERHAHYHDALVRVADHLFATGQDDALVLLGLED